MRQPFYTQRHRLHIDNSFKAVLRRPMGRVGRYLMGHGTDRPYDTRQTTYISKHNKDTESHTHTETQNLTKTSRSKLPCAAPEWSETRQPK